MEVIKILELLASHNLVKLSKVSGSYYQVHCPFHSNGEERRPSCGVLLEDQVRNGRTYKQGNWHCFACGYAESMKNAVNTIFSSHTVTPQFKQEILDLIGDEDSSEFDLLIPEGTMKSLNSKYAINYLKSLTKKPIEYVSEEELASYRFTVPYMYERGLTDEIIEKYDIGFDANYIPRGRKRPVPCITFPVRDKNGNTLFIARRSVEGKFFFLPEDVDKPVYGLYELPKDTKSVVIVESVFNMTSCVKFGKPAVALLGTGNVLQLNQLRQLGAKEFILGFDPDDAGRRATNRLKRQLQDIAIVWQFEGIPEGKDINDLTFEEFQSLNLI